MIRKKTEGNEKERGKDRRREDGGEGRGSGGREKKSRRRRRWKNNKEMRNGRKGSVGRWNRIMGTKREREQRKKEGEEKENR